MIANHWCEWAADYHSPTHRPDILDFGRLPDSRQRAAFCAAYLRGLLSGLGLEAPPPDAGGGAEDGEEDIAALEDVAAASVAAAAGGERGKAGVGDMRCVWSWLELHGIERPPAASTAAGAAAAGGIGAAGQQRPPPPRRPVPRRAWRSLLGSLTAASGAYEAVSHLQWALWGLLQAARGGCAGGGGGGSGCGGWGAGANAISPTTNSSSSFDYLSYSSQRWREYLRTVGSGVIVSD